MADGAQWLAGHGAGDPRSPPQARRGRAAPGCERSRPTARRAGPTCTMRLGPPLCCRESSADCHEHRRDPSGHAQRAALQWDLAITTDHNHVESEPHSGGTFWVHRKGAMAAAHDQWGALPGSMGTASFHVQGRGCSQALCSSAHGAGRLMSRTAARRTVTARELQRQMAGIWYDYRHAEQLRDEAPSSYKDIRAVARAQRELVKIVRVLRPVLNYKGP